jgi:hypothetical protein
LLVKLPPALGVAPDPAPNALGHWYANLLHLGGKPHILALSERSMLSVLLPAAPYANLLTRFPFALEELLRALSFPQVLISAELRHYGQFCLTPTVSRSTVSSLNQYMHGLKADVMFNPGHSLMKRQLWLSEYISEVIGFRAPHEAALELLTNERA